MGFLDAFRRSQDEPVILEAALPGPPASPERSGYEVGIPRGGLTEYNAQIGGSTQSDRRSLMVELYDSYRTCVWSWACVNVIARTITAGGLVTDWNNDDGEGDEDTPDKPAEVLLLERLLRFTNPREDIRQLLRSTIADLLVFGDAYIEVVWVGNQPVALYTLDSPTTSPIADEHGNVTKYVQVTDFGQRAEFEPRDVIHISLDSPRSGVFGVSPTQAASLPIQIWLHADATLKEFYRKGAPPSIQADMPAGTSSGESNRWTHQYMTRNVGARNIGNPIVTKGGTIKELQQRKVEEILNTLDQKRDEIVATYGVPPAEAGIIESGNLGGGTGESQRKTFLVNTCQPLAELVLEKLNFHLVNQGFGITDWHVKFGEVDMRDSQVIEAIRDMRLRNGSWTLNKYRTTIGEPAVDGGDDAVLVDRQNLVLWRDMDAMSKAGIAAKTKGTDIEMGEPGDPETPVQLSKAEPAPVPDALAPFAGQQNSPAPTAGGEPTDDEAPAETRRRSNGRPLRESWSTSYARRRQQAMKELPRADRAA